MTTQTQPALTNCSLIDWPAYHGERTLAKIAQRIATENHVQDGEVIIGHSLGGMIACEIAKIRRLKLLILVSSASRKEEVGWLLALLHPLANITPFRLAQRFARALPGDLCKMFAQSNADFIRVTCKAIFEWDGLGANSVPLKRIHGRYDPVIPLPANVDCVVNGRHVIPMTHPQQCVAFIRACL